jgi:hypothetical protein
MKIQTVTPKFGERGKAVMPTVVFKGASHAAGAKKLAHRALFGLFLVQFFVVWAGCFSQYHSRRPQLWPEALLVLLAAANTLATTSRELPWQNVLAASGLITVISSASERLAGLIGAPLSPLVTSVSWAGPFVGLVAILTARGIARLAVFRWAKTSFYGLWLIGLAALLVVLFDIGLHSFCAARLTLPPAPLSWLQLLYWWVTAALALIAATPWLIDKRPVESVPARQPMISWFLLSFLFASTTALAGSWLMTAIIVIANGLILVLAFSGRPLFQRRKKSVVASNS